MAKYEIKIITGHERSEAIKNYLLLYAKETNCEITYKRRR
jgi:hypothetical protein